MSAATELAAQLRDAASLGRLLTRVENDPAYRAELLAQLPTVEQRAHRIGITGSPGVGKSTLLGRLIPLLASGHDRASSTTSDAANRGQGSGVKGQGSQAQTSQHASDESMPLEPGTLNLGPAVLAIDPTSAQTGGAVLADRFRWNDLPAGVFVRSLASRGSLAGVSAATDACARVLEAAGYDPIVIETVGVGQTGFDVRQLADTVVFLLSPESGDALQLLKAGLIETGDIFVVNKADRPGADALLTDLHNALECESATWLPPVLATVAETGTGVAQLTKSLREHRDWLSLHPKEFGQLHLRWQREGEVRALLAKLVECALASLEQVLPQLMSGDLSAKQAANLLIRSALERDN
jgi:LAO/AO transport system kinase